MASTHQLPTDGAFWRIFNETEAELKGKTRVKRLVRSKVLQRFATEYKISVEAINRHDNGSIYMAVSLIMRLLFPSSEQARQNFLRELDRGELAFLCAVQIARGNIRSREEYVPPRSTIIKKTAIELAALLDSVCELGLRHGYSPEEVAEALELAKEGLDEHERAKPQTR